MMARRNLAKFHCTEVETFLVHVHKLLNKKEIKPSLVLPEVILLSEKYENRFTWHKIIQREYKVLFCPIRTQYSESCLELDS